MNQQVPLDRKSSHFLSSLAIARDRLTVALTLMDVVRLCSGVPNVSTRMLKVPTVIQAFDAFASTVESKSRILLAVRFANLHDLVCDANFEEAETSAALLSQDLNYLKDFAPQATSEAQVELEHVLATICRRQHPQPRQGS